MQSNSLGARALGRMQRILADRMFRRVLIMRNRVPLISFSFDDFPTSALHTGGMIIERFGARATYYAALGLMGQMAPAGRLFDAADLNLLLKNKHELGCHTYDHCDSWNTPRHALAASAHRNQEVFSGLFPGRKLQSFSFPISYPRPLTKRLLGGSYQSCRGGGQTFQAGAADLNMLKAFFLEKTRNNSTMVKQVIDQNRQECGWLIFATHDVCDTPSPYGCTPSFFAEIVEYAAASGAKILPVGSALDYLRTDSAPLHQ